MAVTNIPNVQNWTVTPQNGQAGYFGLMNTWLGQSTLVIASLQTAITAQNIANNQINALAIQAENNAIIATGLANFQGAYSTSVTYSKGQSVEYPSGSKIYYTSKVDNNLNHALTDTNYWLYSPINDKIDKDYADLKVALAAFTGANQALGGLTGYQKLPGGLIIQWGTTASISNGGGGQSLIYPIAFPNNSFQPIICNGDNNISLYNLSVISAQISRHGFGWVTSVANTEHRINWIVMGY